MGRKHSTNPNLPQRMRARRRTRKYREDVTYYFYDAGIINGKRTEIPLGTDYPAALKKWAELESEQYPDTAAPDFNNAAVRYRNEVIPTKKPKTQRDNHYQLDKLLAFFGGSNPAPLNAIQPCHIKQYFDWRKDAPIAANREIALFSHIWTMCQPHNWNYTDRPNPAKGIKRNQETPRDTYIEDYLFRILYDHADGAVKDALEMAYLLGQRPADVLKIHTKHIYNNILTIKQNKTGAHLRFNITGRLKTIIDRLQSNNSGYLFKNNRGGKLNVDALGRRFAKIRAAAIAANPELQEELSACQFRDLRAKSCTDTFLQSDSIESAQRHLGHASPTMTKRYIRRDKVLQPLENCGTLLDIAEQSEK